MLTKTIQVSDGTIEYVTEGKGPLVILLHGAGANATTNWQATIDHLKNRYQVVAVNLPAAGNTVWADTAYRFDQISEIIWVVADEERAQTIHLVGYSTGAMLALHAAGMQPTRVDKLVVLAPWLTNDARTQFFFQFWGDLLLDSTELFARFNTLTALSATSHTHMDREAFEGTVSSFSQGFDPVELGKAIRVNESLTVINDLPRITAKTTVIGFSDDQICPVHYARKVAEGIDKALYLEINAGHAGPWEATVEMNNAIEAGLI